MLVNNMHMKWWLTELLTAYKTWVWSANSNKYNQLEYALNVLDYFVVVSKLESYFELGDKVITPSL